MQHITIDQIENGYTVYYDSNTSFQSSKEDVVKKLKEVIGLKDNNINKDYISCVIAELEKDNIILKKDIEDMQNKLNDNESFIVVLNDIIS